MSCLPAVIGLAIVILIVNGVGPIEANSLTTKEEERSFFQEVAIKLIKSYQKFPLLKFSSCKYQPTCSKFYILGGGGR